MFICPKLAIGHFTSFELNMFSTSISNVKQSYKTSFSAQTNPSSSLKTDRNSHSLIFPFSHFYIFLQKLSKPSSSLHCSIIWTIFGSFFKQQIPAGTPFHALFSPWTSNGNLRFEHLQALLSQGSSSIHQHKP